MLPLDKIVPPLDLCLQIPRGSFAESSLYYRYCGGMGWLCLDRVKTENDPMWREVFHAGNRCPAPTLSEIMEDLPRDDGYNDLHLNYVASGKFSGWHIYYIGDRKRHCYDQNAATASLKLWLELNKKGN